MLLCLQVFQLQQEKKKLQEDFSALLQDRESLERRCSLLQREQSQLGPRLEESQWEVGVLAHTPASHTPASHTPTNQTPANQTPANQSPDNHTPANQESGTHWHVKHQREGL